MSTEKEIVLLMLLLLWITCKMFFCSLRKRKGVFFAQKHQRPCTEQNDGLGIKEIYFLMEKNNQWQKFSCPQKAQLLCREKKLGQANGWDNVMADIGNGKRENLVIQKCHLCIFLLHKAKTSLSSATTQVTSRWISSRMLWLTEQVMNIWCAL